MSIEIIDVADLDVIFLTYDEPRKEEFWIKIQNMLPWSKRVDGIKGSDAAHKAAADASDTERFILIDGDNLPDPEFFNQQLSLDSGSHDHVFRWRARNHINGLMYGNGGLSCWTKDFVYNMKTHEASDGSADTQVEFCFDPKYISMHDCYSTTYPNGSAFQAWRAGFREGVKMCLDRGVRPTLDNFKKSINARNYDNLCIWQTVGMDVENGAAAIYGARLGTYYTILTDWDHTEVQDFDKLATLWDCHKDDDLTTELFKVGDTLRTRLGLPIVEMDADNSRFFKQHYMKQFTNLSISISEMSVYEKQKK